MPNAIKHSSVSLYADDICHYFSSNNPQTIANNVNEDLEYVAL